jgi:hypothetical protein
LDYVWQYSMVKRSIILKLHIAPPIKYWNKTFK